MDTSTRDNDRTLTRDYGGQTIAPCVRWGDISTAHLDPPVGAKIVDRVLTGLPPFVPSSTTGEISVCTVDGNTTFQASDFEDRVRWTTQKPGPSEREEGTLRGWAC
jgi:hypothetical protein